MTENQQRTQIINRPPLMRRFLAQQDRKLTLVEAPAGYGKTTLMKSWMQQLEAMGAATAWVSVSTDDGETQNLFEGLLTHLNRDDPGGPVNKGPPMASKAAGLDNEAARSIFRILNDNSHDRFLFIDDFHEAGPLDTEFVTRLTQRSSERLHLVLGTREAPDFPLAKLRVDNQVSDFSLEDLKFDRSETEQLLSGVVSHELIERYFEYSEGWVAALQLLRQSAWSSEPIDLQQRGAFGQHSDIANYLNEQFFLQLSDDQRAFLLDTAHLKSVNGDLTDHIRERTDSWRILSELSESHSLVFEHPSRGGLWYRYHQLLRDFLIKKQNLFGEAVLSKLHIRAAEWLYQNDRLSSAIRHANRAGAPDMAAQMILDAGGLQIGIREGSLKLAACMEQIPLRLVNNSPRLSIARAYLLLKGARVQEAILHITEVRENADPADEALTRELVMVEAHLRLYEDRHLSRAQLAALEHTAKTTPVKYQLMRGVLFNFLCVFYLQSGELKKAWMAGESAMALYEDLGIAHLKFFMYLHLSVIDLDLGRYASALEARKTACDVTRDHFSFDPALLALSDIFYSEIALEGNDVEQLEDRISHALEQADRSESWSEAFLAGYQTCLALCFRRNDFSAAVEYVSRAETMIARRGMWRFSRQIKMLQLELAVRSEQETEARRLASGIRAMLLEKDQDKNLRWRGNILARLALARFEARFGTPDEALRIIGTVETDCEAGALVRYLLRARLLKLIVAVQTDDRETASASLKSALSLVDDHRFVGAFLNEGDAFADAARQTVRQTGVTGFNTQELAFLAKILWTHANDADASQATILMEILTERELAVLRQLAEGHSNKVIARHFSLSEPTVKFHVKNIFGKLGVNSRKMAANLAISHGLGAG
ncbi:MAG: LuxR C-terminal-related transcriptional regulator [Alphaproteobacteria bacterium]|nr:LuxR C-terminal-related transcriptional regulator [Alphaproteobacteria bacterium]